MSPGVSERRPRERRGTASEAHRAGGVKRAGSSPQQGLRVYGTTRPRIAGGRPAPLDEGRASREFGDAATACTRNSDITRVR